MKVIAKKNRELALINAQNTQNENRAETITLVVPEEYEDYNKKIVFITDDETVWDIITNNEYKITNAITKYKQVDFYIWLTKDDVDFRTETRPLRFYYNKDASDEITPEEISGVNTVVNILEEEITKVDSLETELRALITDIQNKLDNGEFDGEDGYTPQKGIDYFTEQDIEEIETDVKNDLEENVLVNYSLIAETGAKIELSINTTNYKLTAILKDKNNATICTSNEIDLPLETMVVNATYDNTTKKIILILQNGTTVEFSVADLVSGLVSESQLQTILSNYYTKIEINNLLNNKVDKVQGKELSSNDFTDVLKEKLEGLENYDDTEIKADISDIQDEQIEQNTDIEKLQTENARLKATLPTTTGEGQAITLDKTAEFEFIKPPLPMGNSEQVQYSGKNWLPIVPAESKTLNGVTLISNGDGSFRLTGTPTANGTILFNLSSQIQLPDTDIYIHIRNKTINTYSGMQIATNVGVGSPQFSSVNRIYSSTIFKNNTLTSIGAYFNTGGGAIDVTFTPSLELIDTDTTYEPYVGGTASPNPDYPQEITNVTGDVEVVVENKNWFNEEKLSQEANYNTYDTTTGLWTCPDMSSNNLYNRSILYNATGYESKRRVEFLIKVQENKRYTLSLINLQQNINWNIGAYDEYGNNIQVFESTQSFKTFTTPANCKYIDIRRESPNTSLVFSHIQLEEGTIASDYVEHKEQTFTFPLGNEKLMLGDYLADDGIHHVRGQVVFDGGEDEVWIYENISVGNNFYIQIPNAKGGNDKIILSNYFKYYQNGDLEADYSCRISASKNLNIRYQNLNNTNDLKTWLSTHNTTVEYELEEEVIVPYTSAQQTVYNQIKQALSYEEQTNIRGSSKGSNPIFDVEGYQNTKLILQDISNAIVALGGV